MAKIIQSLAFVLFTCLFLGCTKGDTAITSKSTNLEASLPSEKIYVAEAQKLVDEIPRTSQPKNEKSSVIEQNKANQWMVENIEGRTMELSIRLLDTKIEVQSKTTYNIQLIFPTNEDVILHVYGPGTFVKAGEVKCGGTDWPVLYMIPYIDFQDQTESTSKRLRGLVGRDIKLKAKIGSGVFADSNQFREGRFFVLSFDNIQVLGFKNVFTSDLRFRQP